MSILAEITDEAVAFLKEAGHEIVEFVISEVQKIVAEVKQTDLGTTALNLVSEISSHDLTGPQKMEHVVGELTQAGERFIAGGGLKGIEISARDFFREVGQSAYNDFKAAIEKIG